MCLADIKSTMGKLVEIISKGWIWNSLQNTLFRRINSSEPWVRPGLVAEKGEYKFQSVGNGSVWNESRRHGVRDS